MKERRVTTETVIDVATELGQHLTNFLKKEKITEAELARRLGVPKSTLNNITTGTTSTPKNEFIEKVADVTGTPYYEVMSMVYPRLKSEIDLLLGDVSPEERRKRLQYARAFELLPPDAQARIRSKIKGDSST